MPFYNYKCESCENEMKNVLAKMGQEETTCSQCGGKAKKQFSGLFAAHGLPNGHNAVRTKK
jgi:putative regulatory protein, FmdB family